VLLKGVGMNGIDCKRNPTGLIWMDPQIERLVGWIRERTTLVMPWMSWLN